jgi:hypothetical protein
MAIVDHDNEAEGGKIPMWITVEAVNRSGQKSKDSVEAAKRQREVKRYDKSNIDEADELFLVNAARLAIPPIVRGIIAMIAIIVARIVGPLIRSPLARQSKRIG